MQVEKYKQTELGEIPEDWFLTAIDNIGEIITGSTPSTKSKEFYGRDFPWATIPDLETKYVRRTKTMLSSLGFKKTRKVPKDSVMVACIGSIGKIGIASLEMSTNQQINSIICKNVNNEFIYYQMSHNQDRLLGIASQVAVPIINKTNFGKFKIALPRRISEQQKIASILSNIDNLIQKTDQVIEQTQRLKKGLMQKLLTKGIGHTNFKNTELGEIPEEWSILTLGETLDLCQYGLSQSLSDFGKYPIFRMNNIKDGYMKNSNLKYIDIDEKVFKQYKLEKEDLLINRTNSIELVGKLGIFLFDGDYTFASYLIRLRTNRKVLNSYFLNYFLNISRSQQKLKNLATHAIGQSNINATNLKTIKIPVPSLSEQQKIASIILRIDNLIEKLRDKKEIEESLKRGLMQQLLTGKIRVKV